MAAWTPAYAESEAEKISRAYLNYLSPDPASSALRLTRRENETCLDLSVIVPCYNVEKYLVKCADSVVSQNMTHSREVIFIDDGSTDSTASLLDKYRGRDNITIISQENRGLSGARNTGMNAARGRYLFFLDSDDYLAPDSLDHLLEEALSKDADIVEAKVRFVSPGQEDIAGEPPVSASCAPVDPTRLSGFAWGKMIRRSLFDTIDFPAGYWFEDSVMSWLLYPQVTRVFYDPRTVYCYRYNPEGISAAAEGGKPKAVDTWWITEQMQRDFASLQLPLTQAFYEVILNQLVLNWWRVSSLAREAQVAVFTLTAAWLQRSFPGRSTENSRLAIVEKALLLQDFNLYDRACQAASGRAKGS